jgi:uncharacterized membrane protein (DUF106 family)
VQLILSHDVNGDGDYESLFLETRHKMETVKHSMQSMKKAFSYLSRKQNMADVLI